MEICSHPMVPRAPLFYFPGGTTAALRLPPSPLRMRGMDGPPPPMKSRLTEAPPLPSAAAPPEFMPDDDSFLEEFLIDDYIVLDGAESPCKEAPEEAGKDVAFPAALSSAVPAEPQPLLEINLPEHDPTEFEWVSLVIDESLHPPSPGVFPCRLATPTKLQPRIQPPEKRRALVLQPVESEPPLRSLNPNLAREAYPNFGKDGHLPIKAKRSKRPRNESRRPDSASSAVYSPSSSSSSGSGSGGSGSYNSFPPYRQSVFFDEGSLPREKPKKKRGRKPRLPGGAGSSSAAMAERRCTHCGSQKTPQWRTGPNGPKTLCNACGVRFKSGRLMPEYRPAASPTFDSHVHANSHRKVLEMRRKKEHRHGDASTPAESF